MAAGSMEHPRWTILLCVTPDCHGRVSGTLLWSQKGPAMVDRGSGMDHLDQLTPGIDGGVGSISPDKSGVNQRPQKKPSSS